MSKTSNIKSYSRIRATTGSIGSSKNRLITLITSTLLVMVTGCQSTPAVLTGQPCWLEQPVTSNTVGQIGIARDFQIPGHKGSPLEKSRARALEALANYLGTEAPDYNNLDLNNDTIYLNGHKVYFAPPYTKEGHIFSYASLKQASGSNQCPINQCSPQQCDPLWLCEPSNKSNAAFLGTSFQASSLPAQYNAALKNAELQARYMYGVDISATEKFLLASSATSTMRLTNTTQTLNTNERENTRFLWTDSCSSGGSLFLNVHSPDLPAKKITDRKSWINNPHQGGKRGAVGIVQKGTASGLLSGKLKLAVERAMLELAQARNVHVKEESIHIDRSDKGRYIVSFLIQDTKISIAVRVAGFHFEETAGGDLRVFAWVVEQP